MVGSRERDVFAPYRGRMDDNNARTFKYGMGRKCKGMWRCDILNLSLGSTNLQKSEMEYQIRLG